MAAQAQTDRGTGGSRPRIGSYLQSAIHQAAGVAKDTLEIVCDDSGMVTAMYFVSV